DLDHEIKKRDGVVRILILGDSFTFGQGVADDEIYPRRMAELAGPQVEIISLAHSGWSTADELQVLTKWPGWVGLDGVPVALERWGGAKVERPVSKYDWAGLTRSEQLEALRRICVEYMQVMESHSPAKNQHIGSAVLFPRLKKVLFGSVSHWESQYFQA